MPLTGLIVGSSLGWPAIFHCYGGLGLIWCVVWFFFGASSPSSSKCISEKERTWIHQELGEGENREVTILFFYLKEESTSKKLQVFN